MEKETPIKININDTCKVKLTELGHQVHFDYRMKELQALKDSGVPCEDLNTKGFFELKINDDGKAEMLLWKLMNIFGPKLFCGQEHFFEDGIIEIEREQS